MTQIAGSSSEDLEQQIITGIRNQTTVFVAITSYHTLIQLYIKNAGLNFFKTPISS